eukprot:TRINITY_DN16255_c0_g1_i3.p1 TRINITY_DN16255_c0_g1~~TRINITY_DN16255_c0_g1_i3.p1  ORF type:complete len:953 (-),score=154.29 TRINITY_DN16255_c0_g1_i3:811-3669(-)
MGAGESVVRNVDKRTSRKEHRPVFEAAVVRFRAAPPEAPNQAFSGHMSRSLRVCIRKRPLFDHEREQGEFDVISGLQRRVVVHDARMQADMRTMFMNHHDFAFDEVFTEEADSDTVYTNTAQDIVQGAALGGRGTVMMYGQTGSGKTFTMTSFYERAAEDLFTHLAATGTPRLVTVCFLELLGDVCYDILNGGSPCNLVTGADGAAHPVPCVEVPVADTSELLALVRMAAKMRATAATGVHDQSSRSHALCRIFVEESVTEDGVVVTPEGALTLVDLAGTEHRIDSAEHNSERQREGAKINASLAALKDCIRATAAGAKFVAFRQNRLTQLLRGCFAAGPSNAEPHPTVVIATVSPCSKDTEHSLNTLRHACVMDGQGDGRGSGKGAYMTGGVVTKELIGEIDVTGIARDRLAKKRAAAAANANGGGQKELAGNEPGSKPPPAHQSKQSNLAKRAALFRNCVKALPLSLAEKLSAARGNFTTDRQRSRLTPQGSGGRRGAPCAGGGAVADCGYGDVYAGHGGFAGPEGELQHSGYPPQVDRDPFLAADIDEADPFGVAPKVAAPPSAQPYVQQAAPAEEPESMGGAGGSAETNLAEASNRDQEKAFELYHRFCAGGRGAHAWRMNDLRLIDTHVVPAIFGDSAKIDWAHPNVGLDELTVLTANLHVQASGASSPGHADVEGRSRRPRGRQASQQTLAPVTGRPGNTPNPADCSSATPRLCGEQQPLEEQPRHQPVASNVRHQDERPLPARRQQPQRGHCSACGDRGCAQCVRSGATNHAGTRRTSPRDRNEDSVGTAQRDRVDRPLPASAASPGDSFDAGDAGSRVTPETSRMHQQQKLQQQQQSYSKRYSSGTTDGGAKSVSCRSGSEEHGVSIGPTRSEHRYAHERFAICQGPCEEDANASEHVAPTRGRLLLDLGKRSDPYQCVECHEHERVDEDQAQLRRGIAVIGTQ